MSGRIARLGPEDFNYLVSSLLFWVSAYLRGKVLTNVGRVGKYF